MEPKQRKLNLRMSNDKPLEMKAEDIPTLVPESILNEWMTDDASPYFKIQEIEYPIKANGITYQESFFESFIGKLNNAPIPGSKDGHETQWGKRGKTDILLVGGKLEKKNNGKGKAYFKNYFPPVGQSGSNDILIKEAKSNMIEFSLVSYTRDEYIEEKDGTGQWNVLESLFGERNDIVGYGEGAMQQKTNAAENIENPDSESVKIKGDSKMDLKESLEIVSNALENNNIGFSELAKRLNMSDKLITAEHANAITAVKKLNELSGGKDVVDFVNGLIEEKKVNAAYVREAKMTELYGPKIDETTKKVNAVREYADTMLRDRDLTDDNRKEIEGTEIFKTLKANQADVFSNANQFGGVVETGAGAETNAIGGKMEV